MRQMPQRSRRDFLGMAALGVVACTVARPGTADAIEPIGRTRPSHLKLSLAAYSYRDCLTGPKQTMDLFDFVTWPPTWRSMPSSRPPTTSPSDVTPTTCIG